VKDGATPKLPPLAAQRPQEVEVRGAEDLERVDLDSPRKSATRTSTTPTGEQEGATRVALRCKRHRRSDARHRGADRSFEPVHSALPAMAELESAQSK
jgi:hypothetical protein